MQSISDHLLVRYLLLSFLPHLSLSFFLLSSVVFISITCSVGWELRSLQSFFKYIHGSTTLERDAGITATGWRNKDAGDCIGGIPSTLIDALQLSDKNNQPNEKILLIRVRDAFFASSGIEESHLTIFLFIYVSMAIFYS